MLTKLVQEVQTLLSSHFRGTSLPGAPTPHYEGRHSQHEGHHPPLRGRHPPPEGQSCHQLVTYVKAESL